MGFPSYFFDGMNRHDRTAIWELEHLGFDVEPTGSRLFCQATDKSDYDIVFKAELTDMAELYEWGWVPGGSVVPDRESGMFESLVNGSVNAIACFDRDFHAKYMRATRLCHRLKGPVSRVDRVAVFREILYGSGGWSQGVMRKEIAVLGCMRWNLKPKERQIATVK